MTHFLADEWDRSRAQKRGGGATLLSLAFDTAEERYVKEPSDPSTPESIFERRWALALLDAVLNRLKLEYEADGRAALFAALRPCLVGERTALPYADLARSLDSTEAAIKSAVHRLRQRYRQLLRDEIASTLDADDDVDDELRHLFAVLAGPGAGPQPFPGAS